MPLETPGHRVATRRKRHATCRKLHARSLRVLSPRILSTIIFLAACSLSFGENAAAGDADSGILPPINQRIDSGDVAPDFRRHVIPLMGRLGCNGRSCHGSFQGRGGFALSLFGYDFKADFEALTDSDAGRVDLDDVHESLILAKPSGRQDHDGGELFSSDSWEHEVLKRWIENGARRNATHDSAAKLASTGTTETGTTETGTIETLHVTPKRIAIGYRDDSAKPHQLKVVAQWDDGTREDVTVLARFQSGDDSIATVNTDGVVRGGARGDTQIVVFYDNAVVTVPVLRPHSDPAASPVQMLASGEALEHPIDRLLADKHRQLGIQPSGLASDSDFMRRASLAITGLLPSASQARDYLSDRDPDKRTRWIDQLLDSPAHATWWATQFCDWTGNNPDQLRNSMPVRGVATQFWHRWIQKRIADNVPYDEIVAGIVTADGRESGESYREYCETMTQLCVNKDADGYAARESMPLYWNRRDFQKPEERAIGFAYAFLGVRIQCAQCHKHPFDRWTKDDFDQFAKLFAPIQARAQTVRPDGKQDQRALLAELTGGEKLRGGELRRALYDAAKKGKAVPHGEVLVALRGPSKSQVQRRKRLQNQGKRVPNVRVPTGRILGDDAVEMRSDPRDDLMRWLREDDNPYFAHALVNRVWASYFGIGLVNPTDDMNLANPPANPELLRHLATQFIEHDYDLRWLHRHIATSDAFARSSDLSETNALDRRHFSRFVPHRLPAEVIKDAVALATASDDQCTKLRSGDITPADANLDNKNLAVTTLAIGAPRERPDFTLSVFGASTRESNCDCDRKPDPSLLQSVYLKNDSEIHAALRSPTGWVHQVCESAGVATPRPLRATGNSG
ncbi:MAG: DUF1549 and DUF1553 domain-containing protein, partial [Planctomycetota bacterium]